jgi:hypothetical protein
MNESEFRALKVGDRVTPLKLTDNFADDPSYEVIAIEDGLIELIDDYNEVILMRPKDLTIVKPAPKRETGLTLAEAIKAHRETGRAFKRGISNSKVYCILDSSDCVVFSTTHMPYKFLAPDFTCNDWMLEPVAKPEPLRVEGRAKCTVGEGPFLQFDLDERLVDKNGNKVMASVVKGKRGRLVFEEDES